MKITIIFNNVPHNERLQTGWGFSAYIEGLEKTILFDTGDNGDILLSNMDKLGIDPANIDIVVLSHIHHDHTGGLSSFLEKNRNCAIYNPEAPLSVCEKAWISGRLGIRIKEQTLAIESKNGLVILTGCAHPGIVKIVRHVKNTLNKEIYLLIGGFHLEYMPGFLVKRIIKDLKKMGVKRVAPSHCTGEGATKLLKEAGGEDFVGLGCGASISIPQQ